MTIASSRPPDRAPETSALHLLQPALVHVNTLGLQQVLADPKGPTPYADWRALSPLLWTRGNPYGLFELDMNSRLDLVLTARAATVTDPRIPHGETTAAST
ncbi:Tn3 family transposase [Streptomyces sp. NPDC054849]